MDIQQRPESSLRDFLHVLFKHKVQILLFFVATVCTVTVGTFMMQPTYEATSQVLVKIGRENLYVPDVPTSGNSSPILHVDQEEQINSEIEILKSRSLAEEVVKKLGPTVLYSDLSEGNKSFLASILPGKGSSLSLAESAVLRFQKDLTIEGVKKSNVIQVSFKNKDRDTAASVVNSLVTLYLGRHLDVHKNPKSYTFFEEQSRLLKDKLALVEDGLKTFKEKHDLSSLQEQRSLLLKEDSALRTAFNQTGSRIVETQHRIGELRKQLTSIPRTVPQGEEVDHNPYLISSLQARLVELQLKEKDLLTKYTDQSRLVGNVKEEIAMVRAKLDEQEKKRYGKSSSGVNLTYQRLEEELFQNEADLKALLAKQKTEGAQLAGYQTRLENLNQFEVRLDQLQREVDVDRQNYRLYLTKFEESRISNAMDTERIANVSLIEPARPPLKPVSPKKLLNLVLGIFLGAFGGLGLAFFSEYLDDSIEKPEQVETALGIPVLASVPVFKN